MTKENQESISFFGHLSQSSGVRKALEEDGRCIVEDMMVDGKLKKFGQSVNGHKVAVFDATLNRETRGLFLVVDDSRYLIKDFILTSQREGDISENEGWDVLAGALRSSRQKFSYAVASKRK